MVIRYMISKPYESVKPFLEWKFLTNSPQVGETLDTDSPYSFHKLAKTGQQKSLTFREFL